MPQRRKIEKGSFGDHFDGLVKHFPTQASAKEDLAREKRRKDERHINERLFARTLDD